MQLNHLTGCERLKTALAPFSKDNFPQSIIIEGAYGPGKKTAAFDIACALFCEHGRACGECGPCRRMIAGSNPDYTLFNPDGLIIKVDDVREIRRLSFILPSESNHKIFVINCANMMNVQAQNALLKVLEEPLSTIFILLCDNLQSLLQTVRSRCMVFSSCELSDEEIANEIAARRPAASKTKAQLAASASRGSLGLALDLIDGDAPKPHALAEEFLEALELSELKTFECCLQVSALARDEILAFCDNACLLLCDLAKRNPACAYALPLYDFLCESSRRLGTNNASVSMIAAAICARSAQIAKK